jgi:hypothetical protein
MKPSSWEEVTRLAAGVCGLLAASSVPHVLYGSVAYRLRTGDQDAEPGDIDIVVSEANFDAICEMLLRARDLRFSPLNTGFSVHAASASLTTPDGLPFDVSFDSFEHYFARHGFDLLRFQTLRSIRVMTDLDLVRAYEISTARGAKQADHQRKLVRLRQLLED